MNAILRFKTRTVNDAMYSELALVIASRVRSDSSRSREPELCSESSGIVGLVLLTETPYTLVVAALAPEGR